MNIIKPIITEKSISNYKKSRQATFQVKLDATKTQIKEAVESIYEVEVDSVNVINRLGKFKVDRMTKNLVRKKKDAKIAIVKLKEKNSIDLFDIDN